MVVDKGTARCVLIALSFDDGVPLLALQVVRAGLVQMLPVQHNVVELLSSGLAPGRPTCPAIYETRDTKECTSSEVVTHYLKLSHQILERVIDGSVGLNY